MSDNALLDQAVALVLKLSPEERTQLIERVTSSLEHKTESPRPHDEHWGKQLNGLLDELGPIELSHPEIDDPVEWVKKIRQDQDALHELDWGQDE